ncbi:hypothetical protein SDC9_164398 [bioreactor metagenome]|uniref:Uncharacterized protein n=1 Tax=bioreactor metagenome TaxID=1076179 RepID=A0A645FU80_9ZZZZ
MRQPGLEAERAQSLDQGGQIDRRRKTLDHQLGIERLAIESGQTRQEPQRGWCVYVLFRIGNSVLMRSLHALFFFVMGYLCQNDYVIAINWAANSNMTFCRRHFSEVLCFRYGGVRSQMRASAQAEVESVHPLAYNAAQALARVVSDSKRSSRCTLKFSSDH